MYIYTLNYPVEKQQNFNPWKKRILEGENWWRNDVTYWWFLRYRSVSVQVYIVTLYVVEYGTFVYIYWIPLLIHPGVIARIISVHSGIVPK